VELGVRRGGREKGKDGRPSGAKIKSMSGKGMECCER